MVRVVEERDCCEVQDMRPYQGTFPMNETYDGRLQFCVHCGQLWIRHKAGWAAKVDPGPQNGPSTMSNKALGA